ncbi:MAG: iron-sulfur cluster assembly scaffold protein [Sphingomonadales bacterium]|nr:iron-sulfur cluster assembly scaffold protein [Sphingomonadales bacterium]
MSTVLYTPEVLALATGLAAYPLVDDLPLRGEARSRSCGSVLAIGLERDAAGRIARLGLRAQACAIGQAAAAIFAAQAIGRDAAAIAGAEAAIGGWLDGAGAMPDWPGLGAIAAARDYPARHGAILLAWRAALSALSSARGDG